MSARDGFDVVIVGAGAAGMACALFAALGDLKPLLVEHTQFVGGTSAWAAGSVWVPNTPHAATVGLEDSVANVMRYFEACCGEYGNRALFAKYLEEGPRAIALLESRTSVKLRPYPLHPDYESDLPGATLAGRALEPVPFDGRLLGRHFTLLRPPIPEFMVLGGMMVNRADIAQLLAMTRAWPSFTYSLRLLARHALDRLTGYARGTRLVMGNALCAQLLHSLLARKVAIRTSTRLESIDTEGGRVIGVTVSREGVREKVRVRRGVVLASGGFNRHPGLRARLAPPGESWCPGAPGHTGEAITLALALGARLGTHALDNAYWTPVSVRTRADGSTAVFPHFVLDRAKPGTVVVNRAGERFVNESSSYHHFGRAMFASRDGVPNNPAYLIADARALRAYGLGMVRPGGRGLAQYLADGYLVRGDSLRELAQHLGIDAAALEATVARMNAYAASGTDEAFGRGCTEYQRNLGDRAIGPNPNLAPIALAPYYALRLVPGDLGASTGLVTDARARVLDADDRPIEGLYAVGNDMNAMFGGTYPGPGITLGPALVFAHVAAQDMAAMPASDSDVAISTQNRALTE